jgi:hypothetical protein
MAAIDARGERLFVQSFSRTDDWLWILTAVDPPLASTIEDAALGGATVAALAGSRVGIERPERLDGLMAPLLRVAGVRSQRAYYEGTRSVIVHQTETGRVEVTPTMRRKREFLQLVDRALTVDDPTPDALGRAIRIALERSE